MAVTLALDKVNNAELGEQPQLFTDHSVALHSTFYVCTRIKNSYLNYNK